jgi:prepilin-type N-terminal cleavage/methylation domain-containing protein
MKKRLISHRLTRGYALLELVLVIAIVAVLVGLLLPKGFDALRTARIQQVQKTVDTLKTAIVSYLSLAGGNGSLPRTRGPAFPPRAPH